MTLRPAARRAVPAAVAALAVASMLPATGFRASAATVPSVGHVWVVVLENEASGQAAFGGSTYLASTLKSQGAFIPNYYAVAHQSLPNYLALISGEGPNSTTQGDCQVYGNVAPSGTPENNYGQEASYGGGCVYQVAPTIGNQLDAVGRSWKGYMEDMGQDPARDNPVTCTDPANPPAKDPTQSAEAPSSANNNQGDQYAARHDPFMYFHSIIDSPECARNVVRLQDPQRGLLKDLTSLSSTPNFSLVVPNLCDDGHDPSTGQSACAAPDATGKPNVGAAAIDDWLTTYVPAIVDSRAFRQDGMLVITYDELGTSADPHYAGFCCNEDTAQSTPANSQFAGTVPDGSSGNTSGGSGGGQVGAIVLSPFVRPGTTSQQAYNHYSLLRTVEDIFHTKGISDGTQDGKGHLGFAGTYTSPGAYDGPCQQQTQGRTVPCQADFGPDVFSDSTGSSFPVVDQSLPKPLPSTPIVVGPPGATGAPSAFGAALPVAASGLTPPSASDSAGAPPEPATGTTTSGAVPALSLRPLAGPVLDDSGGSAPLGLVLLLVLVPLAAVSSSVGLFRRRGGAG